MPSVDFNCDLGEGAGQDEALMPWITSANIACGGHAGDLATMTATIAFAQHARVAIGAHPGFVDREHFGRRELRLSDKEIFTLMVEQVSALQAITRVRHVKPHGGLYNLAARDPQVARVVVRAVRACDPTLILFGLSGSALVVEGVAAGLRVAQEVFADRTYQADGSLTPRGQPDAQVETAEAAAAQAVGFVRTQSVRAVNGARVRVQADTVCLHGDGADAVSYARGLRAALQSAGVTIAVYTPG